MSSTSCFHIKFSDHWCCSHERQKLMEEWREKRADSKDMAGTIVSARQTIVREEERRRWKRKRERAKDRRSVVLVDDEVALLLSLNTMRGSWANSDRSETARRLTPPVSMGAHKTRALGGPEPPLASSTLVQPIINKACLDPNALYSDIPSALDSELARRRPYPLSPLSPPPSFLLSLIKRLQESVWDNRYAYHSHSAFLICDYTLPPINWS